MKGSCEEEWDTEKIEQEACHLFDLALLLQTEGGQCEINVSLIIYCEK
jgi:hypothetical protein